MRYFVCGARIDARLNFPSLVGGELIVVGYISCDLVGAKCIVG